MVTRQIRVKGRVQGVGYRESLRLEAQKLGVTGWVRNRTDGSVEAVLQGNAEIVEILIAWARTGPPAARVDSVDSADPEPQFDRVYDRFDRRPTG